MHYTKTKRAVTFVETIAECGAEQTVGAATRRTNILDPAVSCGLLHRRDWQGTTV